MTNHFRTRPLIAALVALTLLSGCAAVRTEPRATTFDFGSLPPSSAQARNLPAVAVADAGIPSSMQSPQMIYRLAYANDQQPRPYAQNRWSMPPGQLFIQRLKATLARAGGVVVPATDGAADIAMLRIDIDDMGQVFESAERSSGQIALRASVFQGRNLVAQKSFVRQAPAPSADAAGGARALADASDAAIADIMAWLTGLPIKRR
jgi:cholesterol transport system auxiliary component